MRDSLVLSMWVATAAIAGCATGSDPSPAADDARAIEGTIMSIDTQPWAYDGNAVVVLESRDGGTISVQLPARWNLCQAVPVDVEALKVGQLARVIGAPADEGDVVVCADASHQLVPLE